VVPPERGWPKRRLVHHKCNNSLPNDVSNDVWGGVAGLAPPVGTDAAPRIGRHVFSLEPQRDTIVASLFSATIPMLGGLQQIRPLRVNRYSHRVTTHI